MTAVRSVLLLSVLLAPPVLLPAPSQEAGGGEARQAAPAATDLSAFAWMVGRWVAEHDGIFMEESWLPAHGDAQIGTFRWVRDGRTLLYELETIEQTGDGPVFRLRHFDRGLVPWKSEADGALSFPLLSVQENRAVFENPERDDPRRVIYARDGDTLTVRLEKEDPEDHPMAFGFRRVE